MSFQVLDITPMIDQQTPDEQPYKTQCIIHVCDSCFKASDMELETFQMYSHCTGSGHQMRGSTHGNVFRIELKRRSNCSGWTLERCHLIITGQAIIQTYSEHYRYSCNNAAKVALGFCYEKWHPPL